MQNEGQFLTTTSTW